MGLDDLLGGADDDQPPFSDHEQQRDRRRTAVLALAAVAAAAMVGVIAGLTAALVDGRDQAQPDRQAIAAPTASVTPALATVAPPSGPGSAPSTAASPTASPTATAPADVPASQVDIGFLVGAQRVDTAPVVAELRFDRVQLLTGDEAERAAEANGDEVTNDYYVVNDNPRIRTLQVLSSTSVTGDASFNSWAGEGGSSGPRPRTLDELLRFVQTDQGRSTLFDLRYDESGSVTAVAERYVP